MHRPVVVLACDRDQAPRRVDEANGVATLGEPERVRTRTSAYIETVAACGGDVVGIDWQLPLDEAWARIGHERAIQGNLDPLTLLAPWRELRVQVDDVLRRAAGRPGHIFNLGHGVLPETDPDLLRRLVELVNAESAR